MIVREYFLITTIEEAFAMAKKDGKNLSYVPEELKTKELCRLAVENNAIALSNVAEEFKTGVLCHIAAENIGYVLDDVPEELKTTDLCHMIVKKNEDALKYVPKNLKKAELYAIAYSDDRTGNDNEDVIVEDKGGYKFKWERGKSNINLEKHGFTFYLARHVFYDRYVTFKEDKKYSDRNNVYGIVKNDEKKRVMVSVDIRGEGNYIKIISARYLDENSPKDMRDIEKYLSRRKTMPMPMLGNSIKAMSERQITSFLIKRYLKK